MTGVLPAGPAAETEPSDVSLVAAAQRGSAAAFASLHARYYGRIYRLAYLKTNNASDAEDVASETFVRALAKLSQFRFPPMPGGVTPSLYPWLHRIAINLVVDSCRQRPPSGVVSLDAPLIAGMRGLLGERLVNDRDALSPQEIVERHEVQQLVRSAIAALPADQGEVLIYRFLGELSTREIAPLMHRSESAVKSLLHRGVVALRAEIERRVDAIERLEAVREHADTQERGAVQHVGRSSVPTHRSMDG